MSRNRSKSTKNTKNKIPPNIHPIYQDYDSDEEEIYNDNSLKEDEINLNRVLKGQQPKTGANISKIDEYANILCRYILLNTNNIGNNNLFSNTDINKKIVNLITNSNETSYKNKLGGGVYSTTKKILDKVSEKFRNLFGYKFCPLDLLAEENEDNKRKFNENEEKESDNKKRKLSTDKKSKPKTKSWVLTYEPVIFPTIDIGNININNYKFPSISKEKSDLFTNFKDGLLNLILILLFLNKGKLTESELNIYMEKIGIKSKNTVINIDNDADNEIENKNSFENTNELLNSFVKEQYLSKTKIFTDIVNQDKKELVYCYGPRACFELTNRKIVDAIISLLNLDIEESDIETKFKKYPVLMRTAEVVDYGLPNK